METIHLLKFNNYFNRRIKRFNSISEYESFEIGKVQVNFIPNDGCTTTQVLNIEDDHSCNYLLVEYEDHFTRWFVIDSTRLRKGQYQFTLRRDLVADSYEDLLSAPSRVKRAMLSADDPLIFNKEDITFNEIKKATQLLRDETEVAWIVGYMDQPTTSDLENVKGKYTNAVTDYSYNNQSEFDSLYPYASFVNTPKYEYRTTSAFIRIAVYNATNNKYLPLTIYNDGTYSYAQNWQDQFSGYVIPIEFIPDAIDRYLKGFISARLSSDKSLFNAYLGGSSIPSAISTENNKTVKIENKYYRIKLVERSNLLSQIEFVNNNYGSPYKNMKNILDSFNLFTKTGMNNDTYGYICYKKTYMIELIETNGNISSFAFDTTPWAFASIDKAPILNDAPYTMFAIPFPLEREHRKSGSGALYDKVNTTRIFAQAGLEYDNPNVANFTKETALAIANAMVNKFQPAPTGKIYDLQILPYCPIKGINGAPGVYASHGNEVFQYIDLDTYAVPTFQKLDVMDSNKMIGQIFFGVESSFTFNIIDRYVLPSDGTELKILNETKKYRIVAPNYSSFSTFNPYMNGGMTKFIIQCTYKPFNPYIRIHIDYGYLYGIDYYDTKGLICGGDYSLPMMTDAWQSYQIQNKNYASVFDREQQHIIVNQKTSLYSSIASSGLSIGTGVIGGALAGSLPGAIAGGVVGTAQSGIGVASTLINNKETLSYAKDMYNFQLGSIQALPNGLAKNSGYDINNALFPFVEYYEATDKEKEILRDLIKYNSMKVDAIGKLEDYLQSSEFFYQAELIRLDSNEYSNKFISELRQELLIGVYLN